MSRRKRTTTISLVLAGGSLVLYGLLNYGGIRSPDSELVFRTAESLVETGGFALEDDLDIWPEFGAPVGVDGRRYSLFGPGQAILAAPLTALAETINSTEWYRGWGDRVPISHYAGDGLPRYLTGTRPTDVRPHAKRFIVSFFNPVVTALAVLVFFHLLLGMTGSLPAAGMVAALFAVGSPMLVYSGTFFSEPLATLFLLLSFLFGYRAPASEGEGVWQSAVSGLFLGIGVACHITAVLFLPFFALIAAGLPKGSTKDWGQSGRRAAAFFALFAVPALLLLAFNQMRFGNPLETGRGIGYGASTGYGEFMAPWKGLTGLLWSAGKGMIWFNPLFLVGLVLWGRLIKAHRLVGWALLAALVSRLFFIASRSDWHGGFSAGPRYMVMAAPFFLLPVAYWARDRIPMSRKQVLSTLGVILVFSASLQIYLSVGEVFYFYNFAKMETAAQGLDVFANDLMYREPGLSPIGHLLQGFRGPWAFQGLDASNRFLWMVLSVIVGGLGIAWTRWMMVLPCPSRRGGDPP